MRRAVFSVVLALSAPAVWLASAASADGNKGAMGLSVYPPADLKWGSGPASLPPGAKLAVLEGNPAKEGPFVMRLKLPRRLSHSAAHTSQAGAGNGHLGAVQYQHGRQVRRREGHAHAGRHVRHLGARHEASRVGHGRDGHPAPRQRAVGDRIRQPGRRPANGEKVASTRPSRIGRVTRNSAWAFCVEFQVVRRTRSVTTSSMDGFEFALMEERHGVGSNCT